MVKKKVMAVRSRVARMKHQQWRIKSNMDKDINRAEAITGEIIADNKHMVFLWPYPPGQHLGQSINDIHNFLGF